MALTSGTRLGPYEILSALGSGGMGEVYTARDTRLDRTVAIKVLPSDAAGDPDLRARFEREARAVAALDHPHICSIYDVGNADGTYYLVMPHLDGQTLAARLEKGALPFEQALKIATETADALDKAHRQGIIHRDLKPANIMLTKAGARLLDFGLAKLRAPAGPISISGMTQLPTRTPETAHGMILGTVQYMAPEQVEGKEADARSDIWGLGSVIYEMVTGTRPFRGDSPASVIGAILRDEPPPISARQPLAPRAFDHLVRLCLAKEPDQRWQSAADVKHELEWIAQNARDSSERSSAPRTRWITVTGWAIAAALLVALGFIVSQADSSGGTASGSEPVIFSVAPPPGGLLTAISASVPAPHLAISPDGRHLVFVAAEPQGQSSLWLRPLNEAYARRLPGTEHAEAPFWSPDSRTVAFFSQGLLKKTDLNPTASPDTVSIVTVDMRGGAWSSSDAIVYAPSGNVGLHRVAPAGGDVSMLKLSYASGDSSTARWPAFLPDGRHFLFQIRDSDPERKGTYVGALDSSSTRRINGSDWGAAYALGYLMFLSGTALMAQPFDLDANAVTGTPVILAHPVAGSSTGYGAFSVSTTGVLAYSSGFSAPTELRWVNRAGTPLTTVGPAADYVDFRLSPDDSRLALSRTDPQSQGPDLWVRDLARGTESRETSGPLTDAAPLWSPAGDRIIFRSNRSSGGVELFQLRPGSAGGAVERVYSSDQQRLAHGLRTSNVLSTDWSPDGQFVIYHVATSETSFDVWALPLEGDRKAIPVAHSRYNEVQGAVSPDGRWIAYASDESGRYEIYVQRFPDATTDQRTTISTGGGLQPQWSKDSDELFYLRPDGVLVSVAVKTRPTFEPGTVTPLFKTPLSTGLNAYRMDYVPARDGKRILMKIPVEGTTPPSITVVLNWPGLLNKAESRK